MANRPPLKVAKNILHKFAQNLLSPKYLKALDILLSPCCELPVISSEVTCNGTNYDIVLTFGQPFELMGRGSAFLLSVGDIKVQGNTGYYVIPDGSNQLVFNNVELVGLTPGTYSLTGQVLFVTKSLDPPSPNTLDRAVVVTIISTELTFPTC